MSMSINGAGQAAATARLAPVVAAGLAAAAEQAAGEKPAPKAAEPSGGGAPTASDPLGGELTVPDLETIQVPEPQQHANSGGYGTGGSSGTRGPRRVG